VQAEERIPIHDLSPNQPVNGVVKRVTISGAIVDIGAEVDGLLHISEMAGDAPVHRASDAVSEGDEVQAWIKKVDHPGRWVTLTMAEPPKYTWQDLSPGIQIEGKVVRLADFGAFVDLGGPTDGLIHISEMSEGRVNKPSDVVQPGDAVTVWVKDVDRKQQRISLSLLEPPKLDIHSLRSGMVLTGKVVRLERFGAFVDIGAGRDGMVHVTEMSDDYVASPKDVVSLGQEVTVRVLDVDPRRGRISLSMKEAIEEPGTVDLGEEAPSAMEIALREAMEDQDLEWPEERRDRRRRKRDKRSRRKQAEIISRTLRDHRD
jgi:small subunit ribosomal protein S1